VGSWRTPLQHADAEKDHGYLRVSNQQAEFGAPSGAEASYLQFNIYFKPSEAQNLFHLLAPRCVRWVSPHPLCWNGHLCTQKQSASGVVRTAGMRNTGIMTRALRKEEAAAETNPDP